MSETNNINCPLVSLLTNRKDDLVLYCDNNVQPKIIDSVKKIASIDEVNSSYQSMCNSVLHNKNGQEVIGVQCFENKPPNIIENFHSSNPTITEIIPDNLSSTLNELIQNYDFLPREDYSKILAPEIQKLSSPTLEAPIISKNYIDNSESILNDFKTTLINLIPNFPLTNIPLPSLNLVNDPPSSISIFIESLNPTNRENIQRFMIETSFLRSYIDFLHDFEYLANKYTQIIKNNIPETFYSKILSNRQDFLNKITKIDEQVITLSGNVNQTSCKKILKQYLETYARYLISQGVYWLTPTKESALMCQVDITNNLEKQNFINILRQDGITHFYIETDKSHIAEILTQNEFNMIKSMSGLRDAGSGVSDKTVVKLAKGRSSPFKIIKIARIFDESKTQKIYDTPEGIIICNNNRLGLVSDFLFSDRYNIYVNNGFNDSDNNELLIYNSIDRKFISVLGQNNNAEQFSVNKLLATINETQLRGEGNSPPLNPTFISKESPQNDSILVLKTYTDFIQLLDIYDIKDIPHIRTTFVTLDILCNDSGMLFGLNTILSGNHSFTHYCFDTRYHSINIQTLQNKYNVINYLITHIDLILSNIPKIFSSFEQYLLNIYKLHYDPPIYYSAFLILNELNEIQQNAISKLEELKYVTNINDINYIKIFPETVKEYIEQICQFSTIRETFENTYEKFDNIIIEFNKISARMTVTNFTEFFYSIKQEIINSLPTKIDITVLDYHIVILIATIISLKNSHSINSFITLFDSIPKTDEVYKYTIEILKYIKIIHDISENSKKNQTWIEYRDRIFTSLSGLEKFDNSKINIDVLVPYKFLIDISTNKKINDITKAFEGGKKNKKKSNKKYFKKLNKKYLRKTNKIYKRKYKKINLSIKRNKNITIKK